MRRVFQQPASLGSDQSREPRDRGACVRLQEGMDREKRAWCGVCSLSQDVAA